MALIHLRLSLSSPDFISPAKAIVLAIPVSLVVFFILEKKFVISFAILAIFTLMGSALINPFYRGSSAARSNAVVNAIRSYPEDGKRWIIENSSLENVAIVAGKRSLTGVYVYPQINLWNRIDNGLSEEKYNRYAHVNFNIDRVLNKNNPTEFMDAGTDQLVIKTEACSKFVEDSNVGYILSSAEISPNDQACVSHIEAIQSGNGPVFYIHTLHF